MSYYDWQHLIKPFRTIPVVQDTTVNLKALHKEPVKPVKLLKTLIRIPAGNFTRIAGDCALIIRQFNYSLPSNLIIVNPREVKLSPPNVENINICVRYRVGTRCYRYNLTQVPPVRAPIDPVDFEIPFAPFYNNQIIKANFVIEIWLVNPISHRGPTIYEDILLDTGVIRIPASENDVDAQYDPAAVATPTELQTVLPENTPTAINALGPWLDNP